MALMSTPPGRWMVRSHLYETCSDEPEDSPHGHAAFFVTVPWVVLYRETVRIYYASAPGHAPGMISLMVNHRRGALPLALALAACGEAVGDGAGPPAVFSETPSAVVTSASGRLKLAVTWSPETPIKGKNAAQLQFLSDDGQPVVGLMIDVVPWMPAHGHGTSVRPVVGDTAPGVFVAQPIYLYMSGSWQLRVAVRGALEDSAIASIEIP